MVIPNSNLPHDLNGMIVVHKHKGVGKVISVDEDDIATIDLNHSQEKISVREVRTVCEHVASHIVDSGHSMKWKVPVSQLIDIPDWYEAPGRMRMGQVLESIIRDQSNVVLPTTNPRGSATAKQKMLDRHLHFLRSGVTFDDDFINIMYQLNTIIDIQFSLYLIKGEERYQDYQDRIEEMSTEMGFGAWQKYIFPSAPEESQERITECLAIIASVISYQGRMTLVESILHVIQTVETRISRNRCIAEEFIRNRISSDRYDKKVTRIA